VIQTRYTTPALVLTPNPNPRTPTRHPNPTQGFPSIVSSLTRQTVAPTLKATIQANQRMVSPGATLLMLNGMLVDVQNFDLYGVCVCVCGLGVILVCLGRG